MCSRFIQNLDQEDVEVILGNCSNKQMFIGRSGVLAAL